MRRVKDTLVIMQWAQYESRCSRIAYSTGIVDAEEYKSLLGIALYIATISKVGDYHANTISKASDPLKFKDERTWTEWEVKFENYLSTIPVV